MFTLENLGGKPKSYKKIIKITNTDQSFQFVQEEKKFPGHGEKQKSEDELVIPHLTSHLVVTIHNVCYFHPGLYAQYN